LHLRTHPRKIASEARERSSVTISPNERTLALTENSSTINCEFVTPSEHTFRVNCYPQICRTAGILLDGAETERRALWLHAGALSSSNYNLFNFLLYRMPTMHGQPGTYALGTKGSRGHWMRCAHIHLLDAKSLDGVYTCASWMALPDVFDVMPRELAYTSACTANVPCIVTLFWRPWSTIFLTEKVTSLIAVNKP
jgi:hypothetical protein